jgi:hypothetical protein
VNANTVGASTVRISVDTTLPGISNSTVIDCDGTMSLGADAFVGVDVQAGETWHFHLHYFGGGMDRNPIVYVLDPTCNDSPQCASQVANACSSSADEHFAFSFPTSGRWRVGIDDGNAADGAQYEISMYKLSCGDGVQTHGENCDTMAPGVMSCSNTCRRLLTSEIATEIEPNDTLPEALVLDYMMNDPSHVQEIQGQLTAMDCYPDIYEFTLASPTTFSATALAANGMACTGTMASYAMEIHFPNGTQSSGTPAPCPTIPSMMLAAGRYTVYLRSNGVTTLYRVRFQLD